MEEPLAMQILGVSLNLSRIDMQYLTQAVDWWINYRLSWHKSPARNYAITGAWFDIDVPLTL
jgi:hypothetical protein